MPVVVFGSANADLVFPVPELPAPGRTVLGAAYGATPGGKGANQAVAAARDGARVAFAGAVGRDPLAAVALSALRASAGVDISRVAETAAPTGCAAICVDPSGRNQIAVAAGANALARADQVEDAALGPGVVVLMQMEVPPEENAKLVARRGGAARARSSTSRRRPTCPAMPCARWTCSSPTSTRRRGSARASAAARPPRPCAARSGAGRTWR